LTALSGEERQHMNGVGFILSKRAREAMISYNLVNPRIIAARFKGTPLNNAAIQVYAPTAESTEEELEGFNEQLEQTIKDLPKKDVKVIVGDWNAKVGTDNGGWKHAMGRYGYGETNERGERLLEFVTV